MYKRINNMKDLYNDLGVEHLLYNNNGKLYSIGSGDMEEDFDLGQLWDYYEPEFRITAQLEYTEVI